MQKNTSDNIPNLINEKFITRTEDNTQKISRRFLKIVNRARVGWSDKNMDVGSRQLAKAASFPLNAANNVILTIDHALQPFVKRLTRKKNNWSEEDDEDEEEHDEDEEEHDEDEEEHDEEADEDEDEDEEEHDEDEDEDEDEDDEDEDEDDEDEDEDEDED